MRPLFHGSLTPLLQSVHNPPFKLRSYLAIGSRYLLHFPRNGRMRYRSKLHKKLP
jgi:hypothetical protein